MSFDDLLDDREVARFVERRLDDGDVVLELDGDAVVRDAAQQIDAVGQLLASRRGPGNVACRTASGTVTGSRAGVGLDVLERAAEPVVAGVDALRLEVVVPALDGECQPVGNRMPLPTSM